GTSVDNARRQLDELYDLHLITEPAPGRYQLHDLLREHARALAATTDPPAESGTAVGRLLDYYLHTALAAARQAPSWTTAPDRPPPPPPPGPPPHPAYPPTGRGLPGTRAAHPARRRRPRRRGRTDPACRPDSRRHRRSPAYPRSLGPSRRPPPDCTGRSK